MPNILIDEYMADMPPIAFKCYVFIARKTIGWNKDSDAISLSQFQAIGISKKSRSSLIKALKYLEDKNLIKVDRKTNINRYSLILGVAQTECETASTSQVPLDNQLVLQENHTSTSQVPSAGTSGEPTINTITINTITKEKNIKKEKFDVFWKNFPRRVNKPASLKSFMKLSMNDINQLLSRLPAVKKYHDKATHPENSFIPDCTHPTTFLNGKRWEDDVYQNNEKSQKEGAAVVDTPEMEACVQRFRALSDGDDVELETSDHEVLGRIGFSVEDAIEEIQLFSLNNLRERIATVWDDARSVA